MTDQPGTTNTQRSSMESFLDEYQYVRLGLAALGVVLIIVVVSISGWRSNFGLILAVMVAGAAHATWSLMRGIRSPISMLVLDLTLWGGVMVLNHQTPIVNPPILAFLSILPVMFASSYWTVAGFLTYLAGWYAVSFFLGAGVSPRSIGVFLSVLVTVAGIDAILVRIRMWLSTLDANRSQLLGTVSHELKNNLTGMLGMTELVITQDDIDPEEAKELIGLAHGQAVDATEIVEDLLTISRIERAALHLERENVDLAREVSTTAHRFGGEGTTVTVVIDKDLPPVEGDALRVRQILRNLISNAVRYGGDTIEVLTRSAEDWVEVVVRDDGEGIPTDESHTMFLPYRRSSSTPRTGTSVGLGLWVSRQLAEAMGGHLTYQRSDGWTEFQLRFKRTEDHAARSFEPVESEKVQATASRGNTPLSAVTVP